MGGHCGVNLLSVPLMFLPYKTKEKNLSPLFKDPDGRPRDCTLCYYFMHHRREWREGQGMDFTILHQIQAVT